MRPRPLWRPLLFTLPLLAIFPNPSHAKTFDLKDQGLVALSSQERMAIRQTVKTLKLKGAALEAKKTELAKTKIGKRADAFCKLQKCPPFNKRCDFHEQYTLKEVWAEGKAKDFAGDTHDEEAILLRSGLLTFPGDEDYEDHLTPKNTEKANHPFRTKRDGFYYLGNFLFTSIVCSNHDLKNHVSELNPHDLVKAMHKSVAQNSPCQNEHAVAKTPLATGLRSAPGNLDHGEPKAESPVAAQIDSTGVDEAAEKAPPPPPLCKVIASVSISKKHLQEKLGLPNEPRDKTLITLLEAGLNQKVGDFLRQPEDVMAAQTLLFKSIPGQKKNAKRPQTPNPEVEIELPRSLFPTVEESKSIFSHVRAPNILTQAKLGIGILLRGTEAKQLTPQNTGIAGGIRNLKDKALHAGIDRAIFMPKNIALRRIDLAEPIRFTQLKSGLYEAEVKVSRILFQLGVEGRWKGQTKPFLDVKKALLGYYSKESPITLRARVQVGEQNNALTFLPIDGNKDITFELSNLSLMYGNTGIRRDGRPVRHHIIGSTVQEQPYLEKFSKEELEHFVSRNFGGANAEEKLNSANNFTSLANQINSREPTALFDPKKILDRFLGPQIKAGMAKGLTQLANANATRLNAYLDTRSTFALNLATLRLLKEKLNPGVEPEPDTLEEEASMIEFLRMVEPKNALASDAEHALTQAKVAQAQLQHQKDTLNTLVQDTKNRVVKGPLRERMKALKDLIFIRHKRANLEAKLGVAHALANITAKAAHYKTMVVFKNLEFQEKRDPALKQAAIQNEGFARLAEAAAQVRWEAQQVMGSSPARNAIAAQSWLLRKAEAFEKKLVSQELRALATPTNLFERMDSKSNPNDRLEFKIDLQEHDDHVTVRISENPRNLEPNQTPSCQIQNDLHAGPLDPLLDACVGFHTDGINSILAEAQRNRLMNLCLAVVGTHIVSCADPRPNKTIVKLGFKGEPKIKWLNQSQLPKTPGSALAALPDWVPYLDLEDLDLKVEGLKSPLAKSAVALISKNLNGKFAFGIQNCEDQQPCMHGQFITTDVRSLKTGPGSELKTELKKQLGFMDALTTRVIRWSLNLANGPLQGAMKSVKLPTAGYHYGYHTINGQLLMCVNEGVIRKQDQ